MLSGGGTMPEFTTVSVQEAQIRTIPGRRGKFINEYADYIQQVPQGQAGKLTVGADEKHTTVRRRLVSAAQALGRNLIIKRSGSDIYFWSEERREEQPRRGRPRRGRAGDNFLPQQLGTSEEGKHPDENGHAATREDSPELGQTEQVVADAMRRVDPE
jgi:hypothetical protein